MLCVVFSQQKTDDFLFRVSCEIPVLAHVLMDFSDVLLLFCFLCSALFSPFCVLVVIWTILCLDLASIVFGFHIPCI